MNGKKSKELRRIATSRKEYQVLKSDAMADNGQNPKPLECRKHKQHKADSSCNKIIVGNNSASYNDKHPHNPIQLNPIGTALRMTRNGKLARLLKSYSNLPRQTLIKTLSF